MSAVGKGRVRKITRKQALAYNKTIPNRMGVTSLVELNGRGSYEEHYKRAQRILNSNPKGKKMAGKKKKVMTRAQYAKKFKGKSQKVINAFYGNYLRIVSGKGVKRGKGKARKHTKKYRIRVTGAGYKLKANRKRARRNMSQDEPEWGERAEQAESDFGGRMYPKRTRGPAKKKGKKTAKKAAGRKASTPRSRYIASRKRLGRSPKQAASDWKLHARGKKHKATPKKTKKAHKGRAAKPFRRLSVRVAGKTRKTYLYRTAKGRYRHLPEYALLGFKSQKAREKAAKTEKGSLRISRKLESISRRRQRAAMLAPRRIMAGKDIFSPNAGRIVSFEEWKKMHANAKKKGKKRVKKTRKGQTRKQLAASRRNVKKAQAARRRKGKGRKHPKKTRKSMSKKPWMKGLRAAHAARRAGKGKKRKTSKSRKYVSRKRSKRVMSGTKWTIRHTAGKRGRGKKRGRKAMYSIHLRRNYSRNIGGAMVSDLTKVVKFGTLIFSGYVVHRALTKVVDNYATAKIAALATSQYRGLISSVVTAAVGIPGAMFLGRKAHVDVAPVVGGMAASLLQGVLMTILNAAGQQNIAGYLSGYADGGSRAYRGMGEYYSFKPQQVFNGMGEFYEVLPQSGFGLDTAQLRQAAGSYPMEAVGFTQAPGAMGAQVTQAAGAAGEYIVYGAEGMGDYEEVIPTGSGVATNDGVRPNLHEAEQALNIVEAAGAMGDLPSQMNVNPTVAQRPVAGEPGGSRAGILAGGDGIFG